MAKTEMLGYALNEHAIGTVIVGSGAAGWAAAVRLWNEGVTNLALISEGIRMGTSRNTGSDKQTYYRLNDSEGDSGLEMAGTLFGGGAMHGDVALIEASLSARCFYNLAESGVPFPHDAYGRFVGYKTDHDPRRRATSAGPLTSKFMTECLERRAKSLGIPQLDRHQVVALLTECGEVRGLLALNLDRLATPSDAFTLIRANNIVWATGGPAGMYETSVYPESQTGSTGLALEIGAVAQNLTESQFGIASLKFRWNLSGTYQQVLPRYFSKDQSGAEYDFLPSYFGSQQEMLNAIFLKGYQWPFDAKKAFASSAVDLAVDHQRSLGRKVYLDFLRNPVEQFTLELLGDEAREYLMRSGADQPTPIERLAHMNTPAIRLYQDHGIDLYREPLEIAVCAQHTNGGLSGDLWWQSNIRGFFPIGEVNGSHGVTRPGGSALNAGQVGALRASSYIAKRRAAAPQPMGGGALGALRTALERVNAVLQPAQAHTDICGMRAAMMHRMSQCGAFIRGEQSARGALAAAWDDVHKLDGAKLASPAELPEYFQLRDLLIAQTAFLSAIADAIANGVRSRGSYLVHDDNGELPRNLPERCRFALDDGSHGALIQQTRWSLDGVAHTWVPVRPIPHPDDWFETIWNAHTRGELYDFTLGV